VVWRNDPDHIELTQEDAYAACMVTSLTGSLMMLTDDPGLLSTEITEPAKRCAPVLFTQPCQVYDVDPSRSSMIHLAGSEVSGEGERPFDASRIPNVHHYMLEINRPYERWTLLGRTKDEGELIDFHELGILPDGDVHHIFEFWNKEYLGEYTGGFYPGEIDSVFKCQLFCIRDRQDNPQLLATSRHISCGGLEIEDLYWESDTLIGSARLDVTEDYFIYVVEPLSYIYQNLECNGGEVLSNELMGLVRTIGFKTSEGEELTWKIIYEKE
jgi:hypothetical protein